MRYIKLKLTCGVQNMLVLIVEKNNVRKVTTHPRLFGSRQLNSILISNAWKCGLDLIRINLKIWHSDRPVVNLA